MVKELANPDVKSVADAARNAGFAPSSVRSTVYGAANDPRISEAVRERQKRSLTHSDITPAEVIGSAVFNMRTSMDDVLDEEGSFDIAQARKTGAIDIIKKHKETRKTVYNPLTKGSETTTVIEIELESPAAARKEVANYIGVENFAPAETKKSELEFALELVKLLRDSYPPTERPFIIPIVRETYPEADAEEFEARAAELLGEGVSQEEGV